MEEAGQISLRYMHGGNPIAQPHENMAEETTVERVTRRSARYQPQATVLRQEIVELQNALQNNRYYVVEEISQYKSHFEGCARTYEAETLETSAVEVAQAVAPIASQLHNAEGHIVAMRR